MANKSVDEFRKEAITAIQEWMTVQSPPLNRSGLARRLGVAESTVSRNLGASGRTLTVSFVEKLSTEVRELAWLLPAYYAALGGDQNPDQLSRSKRRAEVRRQIAELEKEAISAIKGVFDAARKLADE